MRVYVNSAMHYSIPILSERSLLFLLSSGVSKNGAGQSLQENLELNKYSLTLLPAEKEFLHILLKKYYRRLLNEFD